MATKKKEKVILAYSGGLDTTAIIPWLKETYGYDVVCVCADCGQGNELDGLEERAKARAEKAADDRKFRHVSPSLPGYLPLRSARRAMSCAAMDTAISSGVSARMARPIGDVTRSNASSAKPYSSLSRAFTPAIFFRLPMTPM